MGLTEMSEGSKKGGQLIGITVQTHWHRTVLDRTGQADKDRQIPDYSSYCGSPAYCKITSKVPQKYVFESPIPITNHLRWWYVWSLSCKHCQRHWSKYCHQVRWRGDTTCIVTLPRIAKLASSVCIEWFTEWRRMELMDRTPGIPGSDKNASTRWASMTRVRVDSKRWKCSSSGAYQDEWLAH